MGYGPPSAALALALALILSGCMPETPKTMFDWGVDTSLPATHLSDAAPHDRAKIYAYKDETQSGPKAAPTGSVSVNALPAATAPAFMWPVEGRVISDFGATENGGRNDGINIAAKLDAPIHASAAGTVSYAGDALKAYGNLVLVKHEGGYTTAYAHADRLLVHRGDLVQKGQIIGYVGQTGDVTSPQLHFEIRANTTPLNPLSLLSTRSARN